MRGYRLDSLRSKRTTAQAATLVVNAVTNATLTVTAAAAGALGNLIRVVLVAGVGNDVALDAAIANNLITVTLGTDGGGAADNTKNTGTLVAAAIDALSEVACATSGTGAGIVAPVAVQSLSGGHDVMTVSGLAKLANVSDLLLRQLERGGACEVPEANRIAAALSVSLSSLGVAV